MIGDTVTEIIQIPTTAGPCNIIIGLWRSGENGDDRLREARLHFRLRVIEVSFHFKTTKRSTILLQSDWDKHFSIQKRTEKSSSLQTYSEYSPPPPPPPPSLECICTWKWLREVHQFYLKKTERSRNRWILAIFSLQTMFEKFQELCEVNLQFRPLSCQTCWIINSSSSWYRSNGQQYRFCLRVPIQMYILYAQVLESIVFACLHNSSVRCHPPPA